MQGIAWKEWRYARSNGWHQDEDDPWNVDALGPVCGGRMPGEAAFWLEMTIAEPLALE
ncbi:hypothetical protein WOB59_03120 [Methylocystis sp. IM4]|uniref:hypothetical protein n=1 Tax=Methylocystis sp. IM4 TaxID=3136560 RepID=UPI00311921C9